MEYNLLSTMEAAAQEADHAGEFDYNEEIPIYEVRKVGVARKNGVTVVKS